MAKQKITLNSVLASQEMNLKDLFSLFWDKRWIVYISASVFLVIGIIAAYTSPKEYEAKCVLLSEQAASASSSSMLALSALAGLPPGPAGDGVGADLYPVILSNQPFLLELGKDTIDLDDGRKVILQEYFRNGEKINAIAAIKGKILGFPNTVIGWFTPKPSPKPASGKKSTGAMHRSIDTGTGKGFSNTADIVELNGNDAQIITLLKPRIRLVQSGRQAILSVKMPEAQLSAEVTKRVLNKLIRYFTDFKTGKQLETVRFLEKRTAEAEEKYKANQQRAASFKDNNFGVIYQSVQSKDLQLQNEFNLSFTVYNQLVTQLEQARIQLKKESPLFTVLEPVYIPASPSEPHESKIIFLNITIGFMLGIMIIVFLVVKSFLSL